MYAKNGSQNCVFYNFLIVILLSLSFDKQINALIVTFSFNVLHHHDINDNKKMSKNDIKISVINKFSKKEIFKILSFPFSKFFKIIR